MAHRLERLVAVSICAAIVAPTPAALAQPHTFAEGLSEFAAAIAGTYGDEGAHVEPALDKMARALAQWDRDIEAFEAHVATETRGGTSTASAGLRTDLGRRYAQRGRWADALRQLDEAIRLDPLDYPAHVLRGDVLEASSRDAEAGEAFRNAWAIRRDDPIAAYKLLRHAAAIDPQSVQGARDALNTAYRSRIDDRTPGKPVTFSGIDVLLEGMGDAPGIAPVIYQPGYAHLARGEYGEAIAEWRRATASDPLIVDPFSPSAAMTKAIAALRQGRTAEARALLERAEARGDSSEAHRVLGLIYWTDSEYHESVAELTEAIRRHPRDERSHLALSRVLNAAGRHPEAERALHETLRILPESALARVWLGSAYEQSNRVAEAQQEFETAAPAVIAGRGAFFASIARLATAAGDVPGAIAALTRSIAARPDDAELHKRLAHALLQQDRADDAFSELVAAVLIDPRDGGAHLGVGRIHLNAGRYYDAVAALRRAVALLPDHTEARYALATALSRVGNAGEAAQEFDRVEQAQRREIADRRRAMAVATLKEEAALRTAEGNHDRAAALWRQAIQRDPGRSSNHLQLAAALVAAGRAEMAVEHYDIAIRLGAEPLAYRQLADVYSSLGRHDDALRIRALYIRTLQNVSSGGGAR